MKEILVKIKNLSIITIIASFVIGIVLLAWPDKSITVVSILTGATTILLGVTAWFILCKRKKHRSGRCRYSVHYSRPYNMH